MATSVDLKFLKQMDNEAKRLAKTLNSQDHWAKPFYSDVHLFKAGVKRIFLGINGKGRKYSHQLDIDDDVEQSVWSGNKPFHNAYLDERWGDEDSGPFEIGQAPLQISVKGAFEAMYGTNWKRVLRDTPCFNLIPISSNGTTDPELDKIWDDGVDWCIRLIEHLKPKFIILHGNGQKPIKGRSVWFALASRYSLIQSSAPIQLKIANYSLFHGVIQEGILDGVSVLGMPPLSFVKRGKPLRRLADGLQEMSRTQQFL